MHDSPQEGRQPSRGREHTILPKFPQNFVKLRTFWAVGADPPLFRFHVEMYSLTPVFAVGKFSVDLSFDIYHTMYFCKFAVVDPGSRGWVGGCI